MCDVYTSKNIKKNNHVIGLKWLINSEKPRSILCGIIYGGILIFSPPFPFFRNLTKQL